MTSLPVFGRTPRLSWGCLISMIPQRPSEEKESRVRPNQGCSASLPLRLPKTHERCGCAGADGWILSVQASLKEMVDEALLSTGCRMLQCIHCCKVCWREYIHRRVQEWLQRMAGGADTGTCYKGVLLNQQYLREPHLSMTEKYSLRREGSAWRVRCQEVALMFMSLLPSMAMRLYTSSALAGTSVDIFS